MKHYHQLSSDQCPSTPTRSVQRIFYLTHTSIPEYILSFYSKETAHVTYSDTSCLTIPSPLSTMTWQVFHTPRAHYKKLLSISNRLIRISISQALHSIVVSWSWPLLLQTHSSYKHLKFYQLRSRSIYAFIAISPTASLK